MKIKYFSLAVALITLLMNGCTQNGTMPQTSSDYPESSVITDTGSEILQVSSEQDDSEYSNAANETNSTVNSVIADLTVGTEEYRGFLIDNVYHSGINGDIHYNVYIPESYDGSRPFALFFTLPGYGGLYFQGVAANIKSEEFGFEAQKYNSEMIVVAPQLNDWRETSANQTIALLEFFLKNYNINRKKVYANGFSGGGETMSIVMGKRPELFTAYLHCSSQWDGNLEVLANSKTPVYLVVGENDEYYGSEPTQRAYDTLYGLYKNQGLSESEINKLLILDIKEHEYFTERGINNEHGGGGFFAYDPEIMGWLFGS